MRQDGCHLELTPVILEILNSIQDLQVFKRLSSCAKTVGQARNQKIKARNDRAQGLA